MPAVRADAEDGLVGAAPGPGERPAPSASRSRSSRSSDRSSTAVSQPGAVAVGARGEHPDARSRGRPPVERRTSSGRTPAPRRGGAQAAFTAGGQPAVAQRVDAPRAGVLDEQERADRGGRAGDRLAAVEAGRRAAEGHAAPDRLTGRPRAAPPGPAGGPAPGCSARRAAEVGGRQRRRGRGPRPAPAASRAGTSSERSPSSTRSRSPWSVSTQGRPGRRRSGVSCVEVAHREHVVQAAARAGLLRRGQEPLRSRGRRRVRVDGGAARRRGPASRSASPGGQVARVVDAAGRQVLVGDLVEQPVDGAPDQAAPGELVDADGDVQAGPSSWARAACGVPVGRYIDRPGSQQHVVDAAVGPCASSALAGARHAGGGPPTAWCRGSGRRRRHGRRCARRSPGSPAA